MTAKQTQIGQTILVGRNNRRATVRAIIGSTVDVGWSFCPPLKICRPAASSAKPLAAKGSRKSPSVHVASAAETAAKNEWNEKMLDALDGGLAGQPAIYKGKLYLVARPSARFDGLHEHRSCQAGPGRIRLAFRSGDGGFSAAIDQIKLVAPGSLAQSVAADLGITEASKAEADAAFAAAGEADAAKRRADDDAGKGGICDECGEPRRSLRTCTDSSGIAGRACPSCRASGHMSFA